MFPNLSSASSSSNIKLFSCVEVEQKTLHEFQLASPANRLQCDDFRQSMNFYLRVVDADESAKGISEANATESLAAGEWKLLGEWEALVDEVAAAASAAATAEKETRSSGRHAFMFAFFAFFASLTATMKAMG